MLQAKIRVGHLRSSGLPPHLFSISDSQEALVCTDVGRSRIGGIDTDEPVESDGLARGSGTASARDRGRSLVLKTASALSVTFLLAMVTVWGTGFRIRTSAPRTAGALSC